MSEFFEIEPDPQPPELWGRSMVCKSLDEAIGAVVADLLQQAMACVSQFGSFHLAVTGDPMASPIYRRLMFDPPLRGLPWPQTHLWLIDELDKPARPRYALIHDLLAQHSGIPHRQVHAIAVDTPDPAEAYQRELREALEWREKGHDRLDMSLICFSDESPSLSMTRIRPDAQPLVARDRSRIAMTPRLINASRLIGIFAAGQDCRDRLARLSQNHDSPWRSIEPVGGDLHWYLDHAACMDPADA